MDPYTATVNAINSMAASPRVHVHTNALQAAVDFILSLRVKKIPVPDVGPSPDGGVAMSWTFEGPRGDIEVDVVFLDLRRIEYREGFAARDGFLSDLVLDDEEDLRGRLLKAWESAEQVV
jgi:hypothetical protein